MPLHTQVNINDRIDEPDGINKYVFFFREPYTGYAGKNGYILQQAGLAHAIYELLNNSFHDRTKNQY
jgi:hypothetical protein